MEWSHIPEHLSPVLVSLGGLQVRWYGFMYLVAFATVYGIAYYRIRKSEVMLTQLQMENAMMWVILGTLFGARFGYVLFYDFQFFIQHPLTIILPFDPDNHWKFTGISGMSFHGGLLGILLSMVIYCRKNRISLVETTDAMIPGTALGYTFGRLGNFINGELFGRVTDSPWGMYFPLDHRHQLRHPSQLYEALFEGIFLFCVLWLWRRRRPFPGFLTALFVVGYGVVRFNIEFFREPDTQLGHLIGFMTMGQILCGLMVLGGLGWMAGLWRMAKRGAPR
jgi:phosphatidylglycerol:prolipoprotein diacylglycerol transferase